jgi:hypothetical protein
MSEHALVYGAAVYMLVLWVVCCLAEFLEDER